MITERPPVGYRLLTDKERWTIKNEQEPDLIGLGDSGRWSLVHPWAPEFGGYKINGYTSLAEYLTNRHGSVIFAIRERGPWRKLALPILAMIWPFVKRGAR